MILINSFITSINKKCHKSLIQKPPHFEKTYFKFVFEFTFVGFLTDALVIVEDAIVGSSFWPNFTVDTFCGLGWSFVGAGWSERVSILGYL